ncbi:magnesium transporter CorA family protein [Mesorhizobium xinjiangense]|uniref:magnesium transporter CorA family protein n=1 Tax=Mesorhizobium xinjiangense TaxID=2678685 RepID=UPI0012EE922C|nr:magnesium transporter CorA family protein [Mesorhizobium xinjiangense]
MIRAFVVENERLRAVDDFQAAAQQIVWADLLAPTDEETALVEGWLGCDIPSREEMEEIEVSSRLYVEDGAYFMTATLPANTDIDRAEMAPVTFVLSGSRLATIRYHEPRAFQTFPQHAEKVAIGCTSADTILLGLLEAIVDRLADVLERAGRDIMELARGIFHPAEKKNASKRDRDFQLILRRIGRKEELVSNIQGSLLTLERLAGFLGGATLQIKSDKVVRARVKTLARDVNSLSDHAGFLSQKITFLLDATLGMINIEQSAIIKIFSVVAVIFLPPTLVASVYGMNFQIMPELHWDIGYPFAIILMIASAVLPFLYFKRRGWL